MDPAVVVMWLLVLLFAAGMVWLVWWNHLRNLRLEQRLMDVDAGLLDDAGIKVTEAIQAPSGSAVLPYSMMRTEVVNPMPMVQVASAPRLIQASSQGVREEILPDRGGIAQSEDDHP